MVNLKKLCVGALLATTICGMGALTPSAEAGKIEDVQARGILLVGSTGDYKPMSYLNKETGKYEGFDVEVAELLAQSLGVKVQYVPTTWKTLQADTMAGKFDIAMCGVTRTFAREQKMNMSHGYLTFGKTILCRKADAKKFTSEADLNKNSVRVMVNPGGTNEKFALSNLPNCTLLVHPQNAEIPALIAEGKADVIIANIIADIVIMLLQDIPQKLNDDGVLLASGIIEERMPDVEAAAQAQGLYVDAVDHRGGWVVMQMKKK